MQNSEKNIELKLHYYEIQNNEKIIIILTIKYKNIINSIIHKIIIPITFLLFYT